MNYILLLILLSVSIVFTLLSFLLPIRLTKKIDINITWRLAFALISTGLWFVMALAVATVDFPVLYTSQIDTTYFYQNLTDLGGVNYTVVHYTNATYATAWATNSYEATGTGTMIFFGLAIMMFLYTVHLILSMLGNRLPPEEKLGGKRYF